MSLTSTDPIVTETIDDMMRLIGFIRAQKHRDPLAALENNLLEMRHRATCA